MHPSDLNEQLEPLRAQTDRLRAVAAEAAPLRIRHELQHTADEPLRRLWLRAQRGELTVPEVMASPEHRRVHGQVYDEAYAAYLRTRESGELPDPEKDDGDLTDALSAGVARLRADVERTEAERARVAEEAEQQEFVHRPRISDR